jgi:hypothetical protein
MHIDTATLTGLEIRHAVRVGDAGRTGIVSSRGTLLSVIDKTVTPSGHRLLVRTLSAPLTSVQQITSRHALVQAFIDRDDLRLELVEILKPLKDVMRLVQRFRQHRGDIDDVWETKVWIDGVDRMASRIADEVERERKRRVKYDMAAECEQINRLQVFVDSLRNIRPLAAEIGATIRGDLVIGSRRRVIEPVSEDEDGDELDSVEELPSADDDPEIPEPGEVEADYPEGMSKRVRMILDTWRNNRAAARRQWWINAE